MRKLWLGSSLIMTAKYELEIVKQYIAKPSIIYHQSIF